MVILSEDLKRGCQQDSSDLREVLLKNYQCEPVAVAVVELTGSGIDEAWAREIRRRSSPDDRPSLDSLLSHNLAPKNR